MWFTHGDVNRLSFWHESDNAPKIEHREFITIQGGESATVATRNDWLDRDGKKICEDRRTLTFATDGKARWIDFDITVKAGDRSVTFGDTKERSMGVRVAGTMNVEAEQGGKIVNSRGDVDGEAWGKRAAWVDYHGPVDGETVGIAILNHPSSFRYPTYWHVRTYGLFAANPFGVSAFEKNEKLDGSHTLQPGQQVTLRYRIVLHRGDEKAGRIGRRFAEYAQTEK